MTQIINDELKKCCEQCHYYMNKPCAWLSLGNEYCDKIMNVNEKIERLNNIINELESYLEQEILEWQDVDDEWTKAQVQEDKIVLNKLKELNK